MFPTPPSEVEGSPRRGNVPGGSPGATPRHSANAASTTAADVRQPTPEEPENTDRARHVKVEGDGFEATREAAASAEEPEARRVPVETGLDSQGT